MSGFVLAVCAEMVHRDLPVVDRARILDEQGFGVEIWDWTTRDLAALAPTGARFTLVATTPFRDAFTVG